MGGGRENENGFDKIRGKGERDGIKVSGVPTDHYPKTVSLVMVCVTSQYGLTRTAINHSLVLFFPLFAFAFV
jgi:hypothetical protein